MTFQVEHLAPFGALVTPNGEANVAELPIAELRDLTRQSHLVLLRGFSTFANTQGFAEYCDQWGEVSLWPFGKVLELIEQENPQDHIFDSNYVPLHWDGMYRPQVPEFQIFHCVKAPAGDQGGRTTFSDTTIALKNASPKTKALWDEATGVYQRKMEFYNSKTRAPVVTEHPTRGYSIIRYNEPPQNHDNDFINHPEISIDGLPDSMVAEFHASLREALYDSHAFYSHSWQSGDVVIADNYTLLHGREAFTSGAPRHLQRVHVLGEPPLDNPHLVAHQ